MSSLTRSPLLSTGSADFNEDLHTHTHCRLNDLEEEKDDFDVASQIPEIERPEKQFDNQIL